MTLIVGIVCTDGVVIASDSDATFGATLGQQRATKVRQLGTASLLFAATGSVGMSQVFADGILARFQDSSFAKNKTPAAAMHVLGTEITNRVGPYLQKAQMSVPLVGNPRAGQNVTCSCLVACPVAGEPCLFRFDHTGAPEQSTPELPFVALGSGEDGAHPFLGFLKRVLWDDHQPTLAQGRLAAAWTIVHVIQTTPGYIGGPLQMGTLTLVGGKMIVTDQYDPTEHKTAIQEAEKTLRDYFSESESTGEEPPKA